MTRKFMECSPPKVNTFNFLHLSTQLLLVVMSMNGFSRWKGEWLNLYIQSAIKHTTNMIPKLVDNGSSTDVVKPSSTWTWPIGHKKLKNICSKKETRGWEITPKYALSNLAKSFVSFVPKSVSWTGARWKLWLFLMSIIEMSLFLSSNKTFPVLGTSLGSHNWGTTGSIITQWFE